MIKCKKCGRLNQDYTSLCPNCSAPMELTQAEVEELFSELDDRLEMNDFTRVVDIHKLLAEAGVVEGERGLALILERGVLVPRDLESAVKYYYSAAKKGDAHSAYKYAKLVVGNESRCDFWLAYAALMGCKEAYADAFALYSKYREKEIAAYYCSLLAEEGDVDAIIEMARRHLYGDGVAQDERYAKWYFDMLERTPLNATKLYRRLQAVEEAGVCPPKLYFTDRNKIIKKLINGARSLGYTKVLLKLCQLYAAGDTKDRTVYLAGLHIEGIEFEKNVYEGIAILEEAMAGGSALGAKLLGDLYANGEHLEKNPRLAMQYYKRAADLGGDDLQEALGDIFHEGALTEPDYTTAYKMYESGAVKGDWGCQSKLKMMNEERERNYVEATKIERVSPEEAFPLFKLSVDAGYLPAHARIGWYYERGIGTEVNRKAAFTHYKAAYEAGDKRAIESLGRCYARGIGTAFDFKRASELLTIAREMGSHSADRELYRIYENKKRHMIRSLYSTAMRLYYNKKYDLCRSMLELCMQLGLGDATYAIGCLYEFGITTAPDRRIALRFYKKAYEQGYSDPRQYHKQSMLRISK